MLKWQRAETIMIKEVNGTMKTENKALNRGKTSNRDKVMQVVAAMVDEGSLKTDPQGSYTGKPKEPLEIPVQDADDL